MERIVITGHSTTATVVPSSSSNSSMVSSSSRSRTEGSDIVKRGSLYVKNPPSFFPATLSIQPWKKRYVILRDIWHSPWTSSSLDIYDSEPLPSDLAAVSGKRHSHRQKSSSASPPAAAADGGGLQHIGGGSHPYTVDLRDVTDVGIYLESRRFQFAFFIQRKDDRQLVFAAESDLDVRCWVAAVRTLANKVKSGERYCSPPPQGGVSLDNTSLPSRVTSGPAWDITHVTVNNNNNNNNNRPTGGSLKTVVDRRHLHLSAPQLNSVRVGPPLRQSQPVATMSDLGRRACSARDRAAGTTLTRDGPAAAPGRGEEDNRTSCRTDHHPLRRLFTASIFGSGHWRSFTKDRRKDSGFCDSFDGGSSSPDIETSQSATVVTPSSSSSSCSNASVELCSSSSEQDMTVTVPSRLVPPPRPPPRRTVSDETTTPTRAACTSRHPPPPRPIDSAGDLGEEDELDDCPAANVDVPPVPPPRPAYTLTQLSCTRRVTTTTNVHSLMP